MEFSYKKNRSIEFLYNFNKYLDPEEKQMNLDFIMLFNYFITCYSRNSLRKFASWKYSRSKKFDFDHESMEENGSMTDLLDIQKEMKVFRDNTHIVNISTFKEDYLFYVKKSLKKLCDTVCIPVKGISYEHRLIINKYREYFEENKIRIKSTKINYEVLEKMQINI